VAFKGSGLTRAHSSFDGRSYLLRFCFELDLDNLLCCYMTASLRGFVEASFSHRQLNSFSVNDAMGERMIAAMGWDGSGDSPSC
jgi:hypothetical protein